MHYLHPFLKTVLGETTPPPPPLIVRVSKTPLLGFMLSSTAKVKIIPHHVYRSFEGKITHNFVGKILLQKMGSECTICIHFSRFFPGEAPGPPPAKGVSPPARFDCAPALDPLDPPLHLHE